MLQVKIVKFPGDARDFSGHNFEIARSTLDVVDVWLGLVDAARKGDFVLALYDGPTLVAVASDDGFTRY